MKKRLTRFFAFVLTIILIGATFTGCSNKSNTTKEKPANIVYIVGNHSNAQPPAINNSIVECSVQSAIENNTLLSVIELDGDPNIEEDNRFEFNLKKNVSATIRRKYIAKMTERVIEAFKNLSPKVAEVNILKVFDIASNELNSTLTSSEFDKHIVIYSTGIQTTGLVNMAKYNILNTKETVDEVIHQLSEKNALPNLDGITVEWYNLNAVAGDQKELTSEMQSNNKYFWDSFIKACGGTVDFKSDNAIDDNTVNYDVGVSVVPVPDDSLSIDEYGKNASIVFTTDQIGFKSDSVEFVNKSKASESVKKIVDYMLFNKDYKLLLAASTATVPPQRRCEEFSRKRAEAVKELIISESNNEISSNRITTIGMGYENPYHVSDISKDGTLIEEKAQQNRAVYAMNIESAEAKQLITAFN